MYKNPKNQIRYWVKWLIQDPDKVENFRGNLEELIYVIKHKPNPLCWIGAHKLEKSYTWYYEPDWYCKRCDEQDATNLRWRYIDWATMHTMHPLAWPFVLFYSIMIKWHDFRHKDDAQN